MEKLSAEDYIIVITVSTFLILLTGIATVIYISISKRKEMNLIYKNIKQQQEFDAVILQTQMEIQEQTLKIISEEIHDNLGQMLSTSKLILSGIQINNPIDEAKIQSVQGYIGDVIVDLKNLSRSLNTDAIKQVGLIKAIEVQLEHLNKTDIKNHLSVTGNQEKLPAKTELVLFRMVQECLNNAIKHAKASNIYLEVCFYDEFITLKISDDGIGFTTDPLPSEGLGLRNMQNRVKVINGILNITSNNKGSTILITVHK